MLPEFTTINTNTSESDDDKGDCHCYEKSCGYIIQGNTTWKEVRLKNPPEPENTYQPNGQSLVMLADSKQDYCMQPENGTCEPAEGEKIVFRPRKEGHCKEAALFLIDRANGALIHQCSGKKVCVENSYVENSTVLLKSTCPKSFPETVIYRTMYVDAPVKMEFYKLGNVWLFSQVDAHEYYPLHPNSVGWLDNMASPSNIDTHFVGRLTAYFIPPITGNYNFTTSASHKGELYIGNVPGVAGQSDFKKLCFTLTIRPKRFQVYWSEQISESVYLLGGEKYFLNGRYFDLTGLNYLTIGVILPNGERVIPITSGYLSRDGCK